MREGTWGTIVVSDIVEIAKLSLLLETRLKERGLMNKSGSLAETLPSDILARIDGLIDNVTELEGLLRIGYAVRQGETLSPPVASAARLMIQEVCEAVYDHDELQAVRQTH
ncbi:hypothetical protein D3C80_711480 [compost metagenome]